MCSCRWDWAGAIINVNKKHLLNLVELARAWLDGPVLLNEVRRLLGGVSLRTVTRAFAPLSQLVAAFGFEMQRFEGTWAFKGDPCVLTEMLTSALGSQQSESRDVVYKRAFRARLQAAGLCIDCKAPTLKESPFCPHHSKLNAIRCSVSRRNRIAKGLCRECKMRAVLGRRMCAAHFVVNRRQQRALYIKRRAQGLCKGCGNLSQNSVRCVVCTRVTKEQKAQRIAHARSKGFCAKCGVRPVEMGPRGGASLCDRCRVVAKRANAQWWAKRRII